MNENQIKAKLTEFEYSNMLNRINNGFDCNYELDQLRAFIRMTRNEQADNQTKIHNYAIRKEYPEYISSSAAAGDWYHGLTLRNQYLKQVRSKAIILRDGMK